MRNNTFEGAGNALTQPATPGTVLASDARDLRSQAELLLSTLRDINRDMLGNYPPPDSPATSGKTADKRSLFEEIGDPLSGARTAISEALDVARTIRGAL
jgi:hypothetical protein